MKIAFVYDRVNKFGGAERVLLALHEVWPKAPLYTAIYNKRKTPWANRFEIIPSFLNKLPFSSTNHEIFPLLTPYAFESFRFDEFDVVLSITSSDAKAIITNPNTLHICYMLTPTRYLWSGYQDHLGNPGFGAVNQLVKGFMQFFSPTLRRWDFIAAQRPDYYLAISKTVVKRIQTYYKRKADVIYPPVDTDFFHPREVHSATAGVTARLPRGEVGGSYFLIVSRLVPYKKIDFAIAAFNQLGWKLKIIGSGIDGERLKKLANQNIEFIDAGLTDEKLCWYYQNCKGLIFPGEEDFGIAAVEAQACGKPVIGINRGGIKEIVVSAVTGELCEDNQKSLIDTLKLFIKRKYSISDCRNNALKYAKKIFQVKIKAAVEDYWKIWKRTF